MEKGQGKIAEILEVREFLERKKPKSTNEIVSTGDTDISLHIRPGPRSS